MNEALRAPARNRHGLVIPPDPATITPERRQKYTKACFISRHHLYYPDKTFRSAGSLATEFMGHKFNHVWLPRFQHNKWHRRYDPFILKNRTYLIPDDDVMETFLDEAHLLDELNVCVRAIDMIDEALYEGRVTHRNSTVHKRESKLTTVEEVVNKASRFEIVTPFIARTVLQDAARIL